MAYLHRTQSLGNTVTRQNLYDIIYTSQLRGVSVTKGGPVDLVCQSAVPSALTFGTWWWDQREQLLRVPVAAVDGSPCSFWMSVGPDCLCTPVYNPSTEYTLTKGMLVSWSEDADHGPRGVVPTKPRDVSTNTTWSIMVDAIRNNINLRSIIGAVQEHVPPASWGPCAYYGFAYVRHHTVKTSSTNIGQYLIPSTAFTGCTADGTGLVAAAPLEMGFTTLHVQEGATSSYTLPRLMPCFLVLPHGSRHNNSTWT